MVKYRRRRPTAQDHPRVEEGAETGGLKRVDEFFGTHRRLRPVGTFLARR